MDKRLGARVFAEPSAEPSKVSIDRPEGGIATFTRKLDNNEKRAYRYGQ